MYEGPEFRHLITIVTIAEECDFGKAAERLPLHNLPRAAIYDTLKRASRRTSLGESRMVLNSLMLDATSFPIPDGCCI
jgi:hypothetical protein